MNKLDELIKELCPNGVEFWPLEKCCNILDNKRKPVSKSTREVGDYPYYGANGIQDYVSDYIFDGTFVLVGEDGSVITQNGNPVVNWAHGKIWVNNHAHIISEGNGVILRFIFHYLQTVNITDLVHGNIPKLTGRDFKAIKIPVPPLEVQHEIVRILDNFTELTAELTTELTARKKQYEYYRDTLLSIKNDIPVVKLKDIATELYRGSGIKRNEVTAEGIPCVRYGEIYTTYNTWFDKCISHTKLEYVSSPKYFENGDILFAITGENIEDIAKSVAYLGNEKCLAGGDIVVMKHKQNPRYLAHVLATQSARLQKGKGKVKSKVVHSDIPSIQEIKIPLPSLEVQQKFADCLDNFEKICIDLNIGLPAEIEARKKQYEYYRDAILTYAATGTLISRQIEPNLIKLLQYIFGYVDIPLDELFATRNGYTPSKNNKAFWEGKTDVPWFRMDDIRENGRVLTDSLQHVTRNAVKGDLFPANSIIISTSATIGEHALLKVASLANQRFTYLMVKERYKDFIDIKYIFYYCFKLSKFCKEHLNKGSFPSVDMESFNGFVFCIPSIERQKEIVAILDRFDKLCNDLTEGLPAEIEARKKQYEYYRDKLLTFKQLEK